MEPTQQNISPALMPTPTNSAPGVHEPKFWKRYLVGSIVVFAITMGYFSYVAYSIDGYFRKTVLIGSITIALGAAIIFYFIYWIISKIGRRFGLLYAVIVWILVIGALIVSSMLYINTSKEVSSAPLNEESIVVPPGTSLSEFPSYIQVDKSRVKSIPGGGMMIPKSAIKFIMTYEECSTTKEVIAKKMCASKYSIEKKDVNLCKSMLRFGSESDGEYVTTLQEECIAQYAIANKEPMLCDSLKNIFINEACFGGIVDQIKDPSECKVMFSKDVDVKDCTDGVLRNQQKQSEMKK